MKNRGWLKNRPFLLPCMMSKKKLNVKCFEIGIFHAFYCTAVQVIWH